MRYFLFSVFSLLIFFSSAVFAECPAFQFPKELVLQERFWNFTVTFDVQDKDGKETLGKLESHFLTWTTKFTLKNKEGKLVATAVSRLLAWGTHIDVTDCEDKKIGEVKINFWKAALMKMNDQNGSSKVYNEYFFYNDKKELIGKTDKYQLYGTDFNVFGAIKPIWPK
jgi:uncharacterized protein YxjI